MQKTKSTFFVFALTLVTAFGTTFSLWGTDITTQLQKVKRAKSHKLTSLPPPTQGSTNLSYILLRTPS
jgi:hypothetical protein